MFLLTLMYKKTAVRLSQTDGSFCTRVLFHAFDQAMTSKLLCERAELIDFDIVVYQAVS